MVVIGLRLVVRLEVMDGIIDELIDDDIAAAANTPNVKILLNNLSKNGILFVKQCNKSKEVQV